MLGFVAFYPVHLRLENVFLLHKHPHIKLSTCTVYASIVTAIFFLHLSFVSPSAVDYLESLISELISYVKDSQLGENSFQAGISEFWKNWDHKLADPYGWNADFF